MTHSDTPVGEKVPMDIAKGSRRYGSLCSGIGGLDLAVEAHFGATAAWHSEVEPAPCTVLERHWPGVPNLGDLKQIDWADVPPVDALTAGYPCQPFSHAGKRKGTDDPRHLWPYIADAVRVLRPRWVVLENVAGHLSLGFGDVLRDLAAAGFDAEWCVLRASDVGACHQRARLFVVATDTDDGVLSSGCRDLAGAAQGGQRAATGADLRSSDRRRGGAAPANAHGGRLQERSEPHGGTDEPGLEAPRRGDADRCSAAPTDPHGMARTPGGALEGGSGSLDEPGAVERAQRLPRVAWGDYEPAIRRWEHLLGRPAPCPTDTEGRLSPPFVEWMQGYPEGWVGDLTRTAALKALGNAVVPQQGLAALRELCPQAAHIGAAA